jgi:hypothetical protein
MACPRCQSESGDAKRWCPVCEADYDLWSRQYAADILWSVLGGMVVVVSIAMGMPLLGIPWIFTTTGIFAGFGTLLGIHRYNRKRRRTQFLRHGVVPRAYLPSKT